MGIAITELTPVEQTALVTQYARALDSRWPRPILGDTLADEIAAKIDYDFQALGVPSSAVRQTALRAKMLDEQVRANPEAPFNYENYAEMYGPLIAQALAEAEASGTPEP